MLEQSPQNEMSDDELQRLRQLDKNYRCRMTEMHNSHEELQGETRSAHEEAKTKCQKNIKVMAMGVLETLANSSTQRRAKGGDWPQGDSPSVCFMQWAFTRSPEAWCPLPPARDLKHAMALRLGSAMGKQGFDSRTALANALNTSGKAKAAPPKKEVVKEVPVAKKKVEKATVVDLAPKTRKDLEEDQRRYLEQKDAEKKQFFAAEQARKVAEAKGADQEVTYVEDKDTRKPKAVSDISDYWKKDLGLLPFMPTDNVQELEVPEELDVSLRLLYLQTLNDQLEQLLRMRFHVFWSQCIFDPAVSRLVDSYLRFCLRSHDLPEGEADSAPLSIEEVNVSKDVSRRMFQLLVRLSRPQESPHEFLSHDKFAQVIHEHQLFDVPKIIDVCVIYGDANRNAVTKIVHSIFKHQPLFKEEFSSVVQHMLDGLLQCCAPLQLAAHNGKLNSQELSVSECKSFLPDMLSCFNASWMCDDQLRRRTTQNHFSTAES
eukprot:symbB.v1.2.008440.t1/scaffold530.1/size191304/8